MILKLEQRDQIRALVLRELYEANETAPGRPIRTEAVARNIEREKPDVDRAVLYLADRQLLKITSKQDPLSSMDPTIFCHIVADGIDVIERPEQKGQGVLDPAVIHQLTVINSMHVSGENIYQNSQHVGGSNHGVMVSHSQAGDITPPSTPFPLNALQALLPEGTSERDAAETLDAETHAAHPLLSRITTAMETIKATAVSAEAVKAVGIWAQKQDVVEWFHHLTTHLLGG